MSREFYAHVKLGRKLQMVGPFENRESAKNAAFALNPKAKTVSTGYGYNGSFDMQWHQSTERDIAWYLGANH